jgi:hypothetical protein
MPYNPIGGRSPDPYDRYRVEGIEADKQSKGEAPAPFGEAKQPSYKLVAYLLYLFHQFLHLFEETEKGIPASAEQEVRDNLLLIKEAIEVLKREDRSQDAPFLNRLSILWHKTLEDSLRFRKETPLAIEFRSFIKAIDSYPEAEEYPFGYYLIEYAGQKWLPFPYMELVQKIHDQHQKNPGSSTLTRWTEMIDGLAKKMQPRD